MRSILACSISLLGLLLPAARATTWYYVTFNPPSGEYFTSLSGNMVAPTLPSAGTYYLWPGLQPTDNSGVYQNVLDGRSGTWWFGSGWCCSNPSLAWGGGFNVANGATVTFSNVKQSDGSWTSTIKDPSSGGSASNNFALQGKNFNDGVFAIELDGPSWNFGQLAFSNIAIVSLLCKSQRALLKFCSFGLPHADLNVRLRRVQMRRGVKPLRITITALPSTLLVVFHPRSKTTSLLVISRA